MGALFKIFHLNVKASVNIITFEIAKSDPLVSLCLIHFKLQTVVPLTEAHELHFQTFKMSADFYL